MATTTFSETTPLLPGENVPRNDDEPRQLENNSQQAKSESANSVFGILSVLLIGVFVSQADVFLVLTTYGQISSEFNALKDGGWLLTAYLLSQSVAQPLYGKLSDTFGRKRCLQFSYILFSAGTLCSSFAQSMPQLIASRALEGCGGAGMVCMVSILLTDLVPLHKVAVYRSYVNLVQTVGRSCGAVVGGYIAQTLGWRWGFFIQCPLVLTGLILTECKLNISGRGSQDGLGKQSVTQKLKRVDFLGAFLLSISILGFLMFLHLGRQELGWINLPVLSAAVTSIIAAVAFLGVEKWYAVEPIFPLRLITHYAVFSSYTMLSMQTSAITSMTFVAPLYFQIVDGVSSSKAGFYMIPGPVGNTVGGLLAGWWIGRTGRYKLPSVVGAGCSVLAFILLIWLWRGTGTICDPFFILPVGFATGIAHSASFIGLTAQVDPADIAIASSGLYLFSNIGMMTGISTANTVYQMSLRNGLHTALAKFSDRKTIIRKLLSDIKFAQEMSESLRGAALPVYILSVQRVLIVGIVASSIVLVCSICARDKKLITS